MFSVVIPVYNNEDTIGLSLKSVTDQTRSDLIEEIVVIDDGSVDGTQDVISEFAKTSAIPVVYEKQANAGPSAARNKAIRMAKAQWIALLDGDDAWHADKIEKQYECIKANPNIYFLGSAYPLKILFKERTGLVKLSAKDICIRSMPNTPTVVFNKEKGLEYGLFNENMRHNEDANFYQKFFLIDSYYILAEDLIDLDLKKAYFGEKGLSSNFDAMYEGKKINMKELLEMHLISKPFYMLMCVFCDIKKLRRNIQRCLKR